MSKLSLDREVVTWTARHLLQHGDTDVFPHPFEFRFFESRLEEIATAIADLNIYTYQPRSGFESLAPKDRFGFRIAHQLYPVDALVFTSAVVTIGEDIERARSPIRDGAAFSFRFEPDLEGNMFSPRHRYKDWFRHQVAFSVFDKYSQVVRTDIADFYQRIYHHRLEHCMSQYTINSGFDKFICKMVEDFRVRQSFGIPVGGNAARLLAEMILCDTDVAVRNEGYEYTRYVDDFVLFIREDQDPYAALALLADHLATNEGLSLNTSKSRIISIGDFHGELVELGSGEDQAQADESATETLYWRAYESEEVDEEALATLQAKDLAEELQQELAAASWDVGKIRILLRALRLSKSRDVSDFVRQNFRNLLPFAKDVVLLIDELVQDGDDTFRDFADEVTNVLLEPATQRLPVTRAWLLELFVRKAVPVEYKTLKNLKSLDGTLDIRQMILLRKQLSDVNYFRRGKSRIDEFNDWLKPAFLYGATCLPTDEYEVWLGNIRKRMSFPLADLFCDWTLDVARGA